MDGFLVIDKPPGLTSHDVVDQVRRILHVRRVGHTGTLDPFATGVLVVMVGRATRLAQFLSGLEKEYEAVIRLGFATDTGDRTGRPIQETQVEPTRLLNAGAAEEIEAALAALHGEIDQIPPMYSAKKQSGRKLYEMARQGEEVERKAVGVCIYELEPMNLASKPAAELLKDNRDGTFDFEVRVVCSAGTYIRTLAEDFGKSLGLGAHVAELRRTRVGDFNIQQSTTIEQLKVHFAEEALGRILREPDEALARLPFVDLNADDLRRVRNGMLVKISQADWSDGEQVRMRDESGRLVAVGKFNSADRSLHPSVVIARDETRKVMKKRYWFGGLSASALAFVAAKLWLRPPDVDWEKNREVVFHAEHSRFADVAGVRVHYQEAGRSDAPPMILIHGFASSNLVWSKVLLELAHAGFRVIAPDLLGYGYSGKPRELDYTIASQARMIVSLLKQLGIARAVVVGSSYGGAVAATIALDNPQLVEKLILIGAVTNNAPTRYLLMRLFGSPIIGDILSPLLMGSRRLLRARMKRVYDRHEWVLDERRVNARHLPLKTRGTHRAIIRTVRRWDAERVSRDANLITQPTLVLWGDNDQEVPLVNGERLHAKLPNSRLIVFRECGHLPHEEYPEAFTKVVTEFL